MKRILLSVKEIAQALGVSVQSIRRVYWRVEIPAYRNSKMLRFDLDQASGSFWPNGCRGSYDHAARDRRREPPTRTAASPPFGKTGALPTGIVTGGL